MTVHDSTVLRNVANGSFRTTFQVDARTPRARRTGDGAEARIVAIVARSSFDRARRSRAAMRRRRRGVKRTKISRGDSLERVLDGDGEAETRSDARWSNAWMETTRGLEMADGADARAEGRAGDATSLEEARRDASEARARFAKTPEPEVRRDGRPSDEARRGRAGSRDAASRRTPNARSMSDVDERRHGSEEVFSILSALGSINLAKETSSFDSSDVKTDVANEYVTFMHEKSAFESRICENSGTERLGFVTNNKENGQMAGSLGSTFTVWTNQ